MRVADAPRAAVEEPGSLKEQIFFEQREKYQTRYNDAQDEATNAAMVLSQQAPLLAAAHQNLQLLSNGLYDRVRALMIARYGSIARTVRNAALLMPLWRAFRRGGLLLKIGLGIFVFWMVSSLAALVAGGENLPAAVLTMPSMSRSPSSSSAISYCAARHPQEKRG